MSPMKEMVTLNRREQKRLVVLNQVEKGKMIGREAAEVLDLSLRHVRGILVVYRKEGAAALAHGNRGRKPHNVLDENLRKQILDLGQTTYAGCNNPHFTELLAERESIAFSRSSMRRILLEAGIRSPRKRSLNLPLSFPECSCMLRPWILSSDSIF
ncbi:MAG: helix-turn-helix domain-containing protein [Dehalococcoidia bacterium]